MQLSKHTLSTLVSTAAFEARELGYQVVALTPANTPFGQEVYQVTKPHGMDFGKFVSILKSRLAKRFPNGPEAAHVAFKQIHPKGHNVTGYVHIKAIS